MKKPIRCIDPIFKDCQECLFGWVKYPGWVETYEDRCGCIFECGCTLGFDTGRPEDAPTEDELKDFEEWSKRKNRVNDISKNKKI